MDCETQELTRSFRQFGIIEDCSIVSDSRGKSRGFAFISFQNQESAVKAAAEPQQTFGGRVIFVSIAKSGMRTPPKGKSDSPRPRDFSDLMRCDSPEFHRSNIIDDPWSHARSDGIQELVETSVLDMSCGGYPMGCGDRRMDLNQLASIGESFAQSLYPYSAAAAAAAYNLIAAAPSYHHSFVRNSLG